MKKYSQNCGYW